MRIFEFQFNPKARKDRFLKVFSFEAPPGEEKGAISMVGDLRNALPENSVLLEKIAEILREEYYKDSTKPQTFVSEAAFKNALKKANAFLAGEAKKDNVDWLGNLHVALLALMPSDKGYTMYFSKAGNTKLWMARHTSLVDMGRSIEAKRKDYGSGNVFGAIGSGNVLAQDRIFVLTEELFDSFSKLNILQDLAQMQEEKQFRELFRNKEKELAKVSGVLYFLFIEPLSKVTQGESKPAFKMPAFALPSFSKEQFFAKPKLLAAPKFTLPEISTKIPSAFGAKAREKIAPFRAIPPMKRAAGLLFILAVILGIGFALLQGGSFRISPEALEALESARNLRLQAEQALASQDEQQANKLLQEAWHTLTPYGEFPEFSALREEIERKLNEVNKVTVLDNLEPLARIDTADLGGAPEAMFALDSTFYVFGPSSAHLVSVDAPSGAQAVFSAGRNLRFGGRFANTFTFFAEPNVVVSFNESSGWSETRVALPNGFRPQGMAVYASNMYLFDGSSAQIIRVAQGTGEPWVDPSSPKKPLDMADIAIDGNIWVIKKSGEIQRYFKGSYQESIEALLFPAFQDPQKIQTMAQLAQLYILEPAEKRVVVLGKDGTLIGQYKSEAFEKASDLVISANGEMVYVLADSAVYQIELL